jgi:hypothetical protein
MSDEKKLFVNGKEATPSVKKKALDTMSRADLDKLIDEKRAAQKAAQDDSE